MLEAYRVDILTTRAIDHLRTLVGFDSVSKHSNLPVVDYIHRTLTPLRIASHFIPAKDNRKSNLLARIGPEAEGGIVLSGHTDVVPVDGQEWDSDPFMLTELDGKLFGRGAADMKSFIAVCLAMAPEFAKLPLKKPIYYAFSYDEEVGCLGVPHMLAYMDEKIPKPAFAIIGEPTMMQVVTAHKGVLSFETVVSGFECHSSQPELGVNAVQVACELVGFLTKLADEQQKNGKRDERFSPAYSTVHVGTIEGGTARNIIPKECRFQWEIRPIPGEDTDALFARFETFCKERAGKMKEVHKEAGIKTRPISRMNPVALPGHATAARERVMRAAQSNQELAVAFGTEAGVFGEHGIPAIVCGPGNIEQAHKPNEFIETMQIQKCVEFMGRLMDELLAA